MLPRTTLASGALAAMALSIALLVGSGPGAAEAPMATCNAIDRIEGDLSGCEVTGVDCLPTRYTGFCCYVEEPIQRDWGGHTRPAGRGPRGAPATSATRHAGDVPSPPTRRSPWRDRPPW